MTEFRIDTHKTYNGRYMYLSCTQQPDVQKNTSIIHWTLTVTGGTSNYYTTGPTTVTIGAKQVYYSPIVYYNAPNSRLPRVLSAARWKFPTKPMAQ